MPEGNSHSAESAVGERALRDQIAALEADKTRLTAELATAQGKIKMFQDIGHNLDLFSISFKESQLSLAALAAIMKEEQRNALDTSGVSTMARAAIDRITQALESSASDCQHAASIVAGLSSKAARILHIIQLIRDCSSKVNYLAHSASAEALKTAPHAQLAPELAAELGNLSCQAAQTIDEITAVAQNIQEETASARRGMDRLAEQSIGISRETSSATQSIQNLLDLSQRMEGAITSSALRSFVELAKIDHLIYKFEIYRVFFGLSDKTARDLPDHKSCRLGRWYYHGDGVDCFSKLAGYTEMEAPHLDVHRYAEEALNAYHAGHTEEGVSALAKMEHASRAVVTDLEKIALAGEQQPEFLCLQ